MNNQMGFIPGDRLRGFLETYLAHIHAVFDDLQIFAEELRRIDINNPREQEILRERIQELRFLVSGHRNNLAPLEHTLRVLTRE